MAKSETIDYGQLKALTERIKGDKDSVDTQGLLLKSHSSIFIQTKRPTPGIPNKTTKSFMYSHPNYGRKLRSRHGGARNLTDKSVPASDTVPSNVEVYDTRPSSSSSSTLEALIRRQQQISELSQIIRKFPFERNRKEHQIASRLFFDLAPSEIITFFGDAEHRRTLSHVIHYATFVSYPEADMTVFGNSGLFMILKGTVRPQTIPYLNLKSMKDGSDYRKPTPILRRRHIKLSPGDCFGTFEKIEGREHNTNVNGSNITDDSHGLCINHEAWGTAIVLVESTFIIIGNLFVLIVLCKYPPRKFKPLNYFIVQLAIADLCIGFIVLWIGFLSAKIYSHMHLISGIIVYGILATTSSASTLSVLYIAVDRYIYILKNNNYKRIMTRTIVILLIAIAWLLPTIVFIVAPLLGWSCVEECDCLLYNSDENAEYCQGDVCSQMMTPFRSETLLIGGLCLLLLLIVSVIIYVMLLSKVRSKTQKPVKQSHRKASELRMIKTMVIVLTGFLLTTGPLGILCIVSYFYNVRSLHFAMRILVVISNVNSIMNPFFYFWRIPQMNRNLKIMWSSFFKFAHNFFCCIPKTRQQKRSSIADSKLYVCGLHHGNQTSESSVSNNSKIHYLSKNVRIKVNFGRKCNANHITTPFNSSDII